MNFAINRELLTLNGETCKMVGKTKQLEAREPNMRKVGQIKLPPRTESIVKVLVAPGSSLVGMTKECEIQQRAFTAISLTKVTDGFIMTSIQNKYDTKVDMQE